MSFSARGAVRQTFSRVEHLAACQPDAAASQTGGHVLGLPLDGNLPVTADRLDCFLIRFDFPDADTRGYALYLLHASPGAAIYLNGAFLGASESFRSPPRDGWNYPLLFSLPATLLRSGANELVIEIGARNGLNRPLDYAEMALQSELYPRFQRELWVRVTGVQIVNFVVGLIGLFGAVLWWRRRSETIFALFALSCAVWIVRNAKFAVLNPLIPASVFVHVVDASLYWLVALLFALSFRILGVHFPRLVAAFFGYAALVTLMSIVTAWQPLFYGLLGLIGASAIFLVFLAWRFYRQRTTLIFLLLLAALVTSATGAFDFMQQADFFPAPRVYFMPYSALFYAVTVGWALIDRFVGAHNDFEQLSIELDSRLQAREGELALRYGEMAELNRDKAVAAERERILRDMHDGLGLQLISSMRMIEKGNLTRQQTAALLSEALDEMRIAIDSVKSSAGDLLVMLGNQRYRLEPRLAAAGIALEWEIGELRDIDGLDTIQVMDTTRIVQEGFTNAMKHSRATSMRLSIHEHESHIEICLSDNGRGFEAGATHAGEGLNNMRQRAARMGAELAVDSRPGLTQIRILLRLPRTAS